ncbi:MAG: FAD-binding oxidoreductase [Deltaproteobacteria bacterium]|nr:FAD-binding oxidoreductase [Deltaproteobacteria bacterium]
MRGDTYIIETLREIVGPDNVISDAKALDGYANDGSFVRPMRPLCAVRPAMVEEVQAVVRLANRERIALFPFSSGTTYQGAHIPTERGITVDLRRMNKIDLLDDVARNAIIEPGVTFAQLAQAAEKKGLKPMTPIGVPEEASVLATYLENTPLYLWPRYKTWETLNVKMVLPTGEIMGTGQMALPDSDRPYHWATNFAVLNRVFFGAQGTLGIGVKAAVTLRNIVQHRKYIIVPLENIEKLNVLSPALMHQEANDECFVANALYFACLFANDKNEITALEKSLPTWIAVIGISGNDEAEVSYKELDIRDVLDRFGLKGDTTLAGIADLQKRLMQEIDHPRGMLNQRRYAGGCSYIACMASNTQLSPLYNLTLQQAQHNGGARAELGWLLMPLNFGGSYYFEPNLYYDPADAAERARTQQLFSNISRTLIHAGAFFPRPYPMWAEEVYFRIGAYHRKIKMCKEIFDPNNIMNPGKLALR